MKVISFALLLICTACAGKPKIQDPIKDPLMAKKEHFHQCYVESDSYQGRKTEEHGTYTLKFRVKPDGYPTDVLMENNPYRDPNLKACVSGVVKKINFGPQIAGSEVTQLMRFYQREEH